MFLKYRGDPTVRKGLFNTGSVRRLRRHLLKTLNVLILLLTKLRAHTQNPSRFLTFSLWFFVNFAEILLIITAILGIVALFLIQASFNLRESSAFLIDSSVFMVITAGNTKQFSVVLSAFYKCLFSNCCRTSFWKWIGTGRPFCCISFVSFFNLMFIDSSFIMLFFLKRFAYSVRIFSRLSSMFTFRILFLLLFPCNLISSLSSPFNPSGGCVFFLSVMSISCLSILFSVLT